MELLTSKLHSVLWRLGLSPLLIDRWSGTRRRLKSSGPVVALTFDDGPDPGSTPLILEVLERTGVKASFFMVGDRARAHPDLARNIASAGHAVGSHSLTHADISTLSWRGAYGEYRDGRRALEEILGAPQRLFRPPRGFLSVPTGMMARILGLRLWLWSNDGEDWKPGVTDEDILASIGDVGPGDVILLHDAPEVEPPGRPRLATAAALERLIRVLSDRGLEPVALSPHSRGIWRTRSPRR